MTLLEPTRRTARAVDDAPQLGRRGFLAGAGALVIGIVLPPAARAQAPASSAAQAAAAATNLVPNAFVRVGADNLITVIVKHHEMGQGITTGLATLVAEELDADWSLVRAEYAPARVPDYGNLAFGGLVQGTGGSTGTANSWEQLRRAGAAARLMLVEAAAKSWNVPASEITTERSVLRHAGSGRQASYGEMAGAAAALPVPQEPALKDPARFTLIGKSAPRLDSAGKTDGTALYTMDVKLEGMLTAIVAHPPVFGGAVASVDDAAARAVPGVVDVVRIPSGVAVLARNTWAAIKGRDALQVTWNEDGGERRSSAEILAEFRTLAGTPGTSARKDGDAAAALQGAAEVLEAEYVFPYLAHAAMEPMNCVIRVEGWGTDAARAESWSGHQLQTIDHGALAQTLNLPLDRVTLHSLISGGSFGRRAVPTSDYVVECAEIVRAIAGRAPVRLVRTREDDMRAGYYRPMALHRARIGLDAGGQVLGWEHRIVSQSILAGTPFEAMLVREGVDSTVVEGVSDSPYTFPAFSLDAHMPRVGVPVLWWRSVGHTHTAFVMETLMDELAQKAGQDPFAFRRALLANHPRHLAVLDLLERESGWAQPLAQGAEGVRRGRGLAVHESFGSVVGQVAELTLGADGKMRVDRIVCAVHCGTAVNPDIVRAQMEGGIGFGLSALYYGEITLDQGRVVQSNFDDYEVLRIDAMPRIEVHIVPSADPPTGVGEPGVPPIGPAVANAIAAAGGARIRALPLRGAGLV